MPSFETLLLAGGRSRRMGADKRFLLVDGVPLIRRTYETVAALEAPVTVLVADEDDATSVKEVLGPAASLRPDDDRGAGPLASLAGALGEIESCYALLVAVDYPRLTAAFLEGLLAHLASMDPPADVLIPVSSRIPQYACAFYRSWLAKDASESLRDGIRSLKEWVGRIDGAVSLLDEGVWRSWEPSGVLLNWNHPRDLDREA